MAACMALAAFAVAVLSGLFATNPPQLILTRALIAMLLCYPAGYIIGLVCDRVMTEHLARYQQEHPIPNGSELNPENSANVTNPSEDEEILTV